MTDDLRAVYARLINLAAGVLKQCHWGDKINARDALRQDDALAYLGYEARQIADLFATPAPAQPEGKEDESAVRPFGFARGHVTPSSPNGPAEFDVDMVYGDDQPEGEGWLPLYLRPSQSAGAAAPAEGVNSLQGDLNDMEEDRDEAYEALRTIVDLVKGDGYYTEHYRLAVLTPDNAVRQVREALVSTPKREPQS